MRTWPWLILCSMLAASGAPAQDAGRTVDPGGTNWNGVWERVTPIDWDLSQRNPGAAPPPLTPAYRKIYDAGLAAMKAGKPHSDPTSRCMPAGMPRMMGMVFPMEIFQRPGQVAIFAEWNGEVRRIYTDGRSYNDDIDPSYHGYSTGHWEQGDLVAETRGLHGPIILDANGLQLSDDLVVAERFHQVDPDTLTDAITLIDPKALTRPWTVVRTYKRAPKIEIREYVCEENNRNPSSDDGTTNLILNKHIAPR